MADKRPAHEVLVERLLTFCDRFHDQAAHPLAMPGLNIEPDLAVVTVMIRELSQILQAMTVPDAKKEDVTRPIAEHLLKSPSYPQDSLAAVYWAQVRDHLEDIIDDLGYGIAKEASA